MSMYIYICRHMRLSIINVYTHIYINVWTEDAHQCSDWNPTGYLGVVCEPAWNHWDGCRAPSRITGANHRAVGIHLVAVQHLRLLAEGEANGV